MDRRVFIGVGSNMGDAAGRCEEAMGRLGSLSGAFTPRFSSLYLTSPVSEIRQRDFVNGAVALQWTRGPRDLLDMLREMEASMERERTVKDGPRTIDLDILLFGDMVLQSPDLIIPHPRMHLRRFALIPCLEIDPDLTHPLYGTSLAACLAAVPTSQKVTRLRPFSGPSPVKT